MNPLLQLAEAGRSIWLDYLRRSLMTGGGLKRLIAEDGVGRSSQTIRALAFRGIL